MCGNIFAPCEILQCFDKRTLSIECLSCYFSGYHLEDYFIDCAQNAGLAPTLCSYHKTFTGAVEEKIGSRLYICPEPEIVGAAGAAIYALEAEE